MTKIAFCYTFLLLGVDKRLFLCIIITVMIIVIY